MWDVKTSGERQMINKGWELGEGLLKRTNKIIKARQQHDLHPKIHIPTLQFSFISNICVYG